MLATFGFIPFGTYLQKERVISHPLCKINTYSILNLNCVYQNKTYSFEPALS